MLAPTGLSKKPKLRLVEPWLDSTLVMWWTQVLFPTASVGNVSDVYIQRGVLKRGIVLKPLGLLKRQSEVSKSAAIATRRMRHTQVAARGRGTESGP